MSYTSRRLPRFAPQAAIVACLAAFALLSADALAAQPPVGLGTADSFAVLAGSSVTNVGLSTINGDLGLSPGTAVIGFPPGTLNGTLHVADAVAGQAQADLSAAYADAAGRTPPFAVSGDLGGLTLTGGVYESASSIGLTGALTLDAQGDPATVFVVKVGSSLTSASGSVVNLVNGAQPCNVFWQIGSSATLGTASTFAGNMLVLTSISMNYGVTLNGRALARNGAVTLINDTINAPHCATGVGTTPGGQGGTTPGSTTTPGGTPGGTTPGGTTAPGSGASPGGGGSSSGGGSTGGGGSAGDGGSASGTATGTSPGLTPSSATGTPTGGTGNGQNGTALLTTAPRSVASAIARFSTTRCVDKTFRAVVNGLLIGRVVFTIGGRWIATQRKRPFMVLIGPGEGIRTLKARVTFTDGTRGVSLRMRFRACAAAKRRVQSKAPTAKAPAFTG